MISEGHPFAVHDSKFFFRGPITPADLLPDGEKKITPGLRKESSKTNPMFVVILLRDSQCVRGSDIEHRTGTRQLPPTGTS
jgi:hypothetical protein